MLTAEEIIEKFGMKPLENEGGFYVETYRSGEILGGEALPGRYGGGRCFGTGILYLLTRESFSAIHRVKSDEMFHFYMGDAVEMVELFDGGGSCVVELGGDIEAGQRVQYVVRRGNWQGCRVKAGGRFALLGTTVSPGFEFADFEVGARAELTAGWGERAELIRELTRV